MELFLQRKYSRRVGCRVKDTGLSQQSLLTEPDGRTHTTSVLNDIEKMMKPLYHVGQLRGFSGSASSQSTSNDGSRVMMLSSVVILVAVGGRDMREI
jgi:hypothetical protein